MVPPAFCRRSRPAPTIVGMPSPSRRARFLVGTTVVATALAGSALVSADFSRGATVGETAIRGERVTVSGGEPAPSANYRVTIVIDWGPSTHPATLPPAAHVSQPVLVNHSERGDLFRVGTLATSGIEFMAEQGGTATLSAEQRADPTVDEVRIAAGINGPGQRSFTLAVDRTNRFVSIVTMLAPSPDWFLGVDSLELFADGVWTPRIEVPLGAYDSGTDNGPRFLSANSDTNPAQPISGPRDSGFTAAAAEGNFGRLIVERLP